MRATEIHGEAGIGRTALPPRPPSARPEGAVDLIAAILRAQPGARGASRRSGRSRTSPSCCGFTRELAPRIAHLCLMGGSIGDGNTTVSAEFNIYADPEAAAIVFESGLPITMIGLDVTHQAGS